MTVDLEYKKKNHSMQDSFKIPVFETIIHHPPPIEWKI